MQHNFLLQKVNEQIEETIENINSLIDLKISVKDEMKVEECYQVMLQEHILAEKEYRENLTYFREAYSALNVKIRERTRSEFRQVLRLYTKLKLNYEVKGLFNRTGNGPIALWDIPFAFEVPKCVLPNYHHPKQRDMNGFVNNCRKSVMHYRYRAHWSKTRAEAHLSQLRQVLATLQAENAEILNMSTKAHANIESCKRSIEEKRVALIDNPPHHIWRDSYHMYAELVRQWFAQIREAEIQGVPLTYSSVMKVRVQQEIKNVGTVGDSTGLDEDTEPDWVARTAVGSVRRLDNTNNLTERLNNAERLPIMKPAKSMNFCTRLPQPPSGPHMVPHGVHGGGHAGEVDEFTRSLGRTSNGFTLTGSCRPTLSKDVMEQLRQTSLPDDSSSSIYEDEVLTPETPLDDNLGFFKDPYIAPLSPAIQARYV